MNIQVKLAGITDAPLGEFPEHMLFVGSTIELNGKMFRIANIKYFASIVDVGVANRLLIGAQPSVEVREMMS